MANQSKRTILNNRNGDQVKLARANSPSVKTLPGRSGKTKCFLKANGTETPYIGVPFAGVISLPLLRYAFSDTKRQEQQ